MTTVSGMPAFYPSADMKKAVPAVPGAFQVAVGQTDDAAGAEERRFLQPSEDMSGAGRSDYRFAAQLIAQETSASPRRSEGSAETTVTMDSNVGKVTLDLEDYYANGRTGQVDLDKVPLLMPSAANIETLAGDVATRLDKLMKDYGIEFAPDVISYNDRGEMQLPEDYPYSDRLQQALEENPGIAREMRDLNSMRSVYAGMQESLRFMEQYSQAGSAAEAEAVIGRYSHLFQNG